VEQMLANEHNNTVEVGMHRALTPSRSRSPAWSDDDNAMQRAIDSQPQYRAPVPTMGNLGQGLSEDEREPLSRFSTSSPVTSCKTSRPATSSLPGGTAWLDSTAARSISLT
jgi:hypothetical protein